MNDDLANYQGASEYFQTANKKRREGLNPAFDIKAIQQQFSAVKGYFTRERIARLQTHGASDASPIFIVGMPRSGTTLVQRIFASDKTVFCAGEMETLDRMSGHMESSTGKRIAFPAVLSHLPSRAMKYYCDQYLDSATAEFRSYRHVLDKNPLNFINIGLIGILFPRARIVHCTPQSAG